MSFDYVLYTILSEHRVPNFIYRSTDTNLQWIIVAVAVTVCFVCIIVIYVLYENRKRSKRRDDTEKQLSAIAAPSSASTLSRISSLFKSFSAMPGAVESDLAPTEREVVPNSSANPSMTADEMYEGKSRRGGNDFEGKCIMPSIDILCLV